MNYAYVMKNGRLAMYRQVANQEYWDTTHMALTDEQLAHTLRPTRRLNAHGPFFRRWFPEGGTILEAGCGTGIWVRRFRENGWNCVGLDYAANTLRRSITVCAELPLINGDAFHLPFPDGSISAYVSFGMIEHFVEGPQSLLKECKRVLAKGGKAIVSVPYYSPMRQNLPTIDEAQALSKGYAFYQYYFTRKQLASELSAAGLIPTGSFHGYSVSLGLPDSRSRIAATLGRLGKIVALLDYVPGLPLLAAHMMFTVAIKPDSYE